MKRIFRLVFMGGIALCAAWPQRATEVGSVEVASRSAKEVVEAIVSSSAAQLQRSSERLARSEAEASQCSRRLEWDPSNRLLAKECHAATVQRDDARVQLDVILFGRERAIADELKKLADSTAARDWGANITRAVKLFNDDLARIQAEVRSLQTGPQTPENVRELERRQNELRALLLRVPEVELLARAAAQANSDAASQVTRLRTEAAKAYQAATAYRVDMTLTYVNGAIEFTRFNLLDAEHENDGLIECIDRARKNVMQPAPHRAVGGAQ